MIYVMSDIHGHYSEFLQLLDKVKFSDEDKLYILGDICDRGPQVMELFFKLIKMPNVYMTLGNHDKIFLEYCKCERAGNIKGKLLAVQARQRCICMGGISTVNQYDKLSDSEKQQVYDYLMKVPLYYVVGKYLLIHAGVNAVYTQSKELKDVLKLQNEYDVLWTKDFYCSEGLSDYVTIFGHTITNVMYYSRTGEKDIYKIWYDVDKIGIDCGVYMENGKLGCLRLDDMCEFYI